MTREMPRFVGHRLAMGSLRAAVVMVVTAVLVAPTLVFAQAYDAGEPAAPAGWRRIRMDGLTVVGTASAAALGQVAQGIAAFRASLPIHFPDLRVDRRMPTFVVVLGDFEAYKRYQPRDSRGRRLETVVGYLSSSPDANFLVFPHVRGEAGSSLIYHEYTHYVIRQSTEAEVPLWLEEGLAEFHATFRPDFSEGSLIGAAAPERVRTLRQEPYVRLRDLLSPSNAGQILRSPRAAVFYAEAWALVHYITMERKNPVQAPLQVYLTTLTATGSHDAAFQAAFGVDVEGMDRELQLYVRHYSFRTMTVPRAHAGRIGPAEPVADADAREIEAALLDGREAPEEFEREDLRPF